MTFVIQWQRRKAKGRGIVRGLRQSGPGQPQTFDDEHEAETECRRLNRASTTYSYIVLPAESELLEYLRSVRSP